MKKKKIAKAELKHQKKFRKMIKKDLAARVTQADQLDYSLELLKRFSERFGWVQDHEEFKNDVTAFLNTGLVPQSFLAVKYEDVTIRPHTASMATPEPGALKDRDEDLAGPFGRCDTCGTRCDSEGCQRDRSHSVAEDARAVMADDVPMRQPDLRVAQEDPHTESGGFRRG